MCLLVFACFIQACSPGFSSRPPAPGDKKASAAPVRTAEKVVKKEERKVPIVYTRSNIARGRTIERVHVEIRELPEKKVPIEAPCATKLEEVLGKIALVDIPSGAPMFKYRFGDFRITRLSDLVKPGKRAVTIATNSALANPFLRQNDHVDVIGTFLIQDTSRDRNSKGTVKKTKVILENVRVLAVGRTFSPGKHGMPTADDEVSKKRRKRRKGKKGATDTSYDNPYIGKKVIRSVTLELTPADCEKLTLAATLVHKLHLATRGEGASLASNSSIEITDDTIAGRKESKVKEESPIQEILWIKGGRGTVVTFDKRKYADYDEDADAPLGCLRPEGR